MILITDYNDYYDIIFDQVNPVMSKTQVNTNFDQVIKRVRKDCLNRWQILDYLYHSLQEKVPLFGLPDSLLNDGLPREARVIVYPKIHKSQPQTTKVVCSLAEALDKYSNRLCVQFIDEKEPCGLVNGASKLVKIGKYGIWFKFKNKEFVEATQPFNLPPNYIKYDICVVEYIGSVAVDLDSAPLFKDTVIEQNLPSTKIKELLEL